MKRPSEGHCGKFQIVLKPGLVVWAEYTLGILAPSREVDIPMMSIQNFRYARHDEPEEPVLVYRFSSPRAVEKVDDPRSGTTSSDDRDGTS